MLTGDELPRSYNWPRLRTCPECTGREYTLAFCILRERAPVGWGLATALSRTDLQRGEYCTQERVDTPTREQHVLCLQGSRLGLLGSLLIRLTRYRRQIRQHLYRRDRKRGELLCSISSALSLFKPSRCIEGHHYFCL